MNRILVTGASGLLGLNFCNFYYKDYEVIGLANKTAVRNAPFQMLSADLESADAAQLLMDLKPDAVLHCAALANIDTCEKEPEKAERINSVLPGRLAAASKKQNIKFVHISTDAVFNGEDCGPDGYHETDRPDPISVYAETKLKGETNVLSENPDALVARVNFYGWSMSGKRSLAEFFFNNLSEGKEMNGFCDVFFCSLYVRYLTDLLLEMMKLDAHGIYHVYSDDHQSKYDFGVSIAKLFGFDPSLIHPVSWKDGGLNARRSPNLIMNTDKLAWLLGHPLPTQRKNLERFHRDSLQGTREQMLNYAA